MTSLSELLDDDLAFIETAKFVSTNFGPSIEIELEAERLGVKDYLVHTLKKYRELYRVFPRLAIPIRDYLVERFGKGYSANIQLPLAGETIRCGQVSKNCQIGYLSNIQSKNLLEFDDKGANVSISPYALFSYLSYTHMSNLLSLPIDLMRTFYAFEAIRGT